MWNNKFKPQIWTTKLQFTLQGPSILFGANKFKLEVFLQSLKKTVVFASDIQTSILKAPTFKKILKQVEDESARRMEHSFPGSRID